MKKCIETKKAPAAIGPYSQAVISNNIVFVSGQLPIVPETGEFAEGGIEAQTKQSLNNLKAIIEASGCSLDDVIKTTIFLKDMNQFTTVNEIYSTYFTENFPARVCVEVARLPKDALVEIEAVAIKN